MKRNYSGVLISILALLAATPGLLALDQFPGEFEETVICENANGPSEPIYIWGTYRIQAQYVEAGDHVTSFFNVYWRADGVGLDSGAEYNMRGKWMEVVQESPPYLFIWNDHFRLIGKGRAENYDTHFKVKILVNANGDPIIDYIDFYECENI